MQQTAVLGKTYSGSYQMGDKLRQWYEGLLQCIERRRQRRELLQLDQRMLKDIGISRADALNEARKPCWKK